MDKINKIKQHMAKLGWTVEEKKSEVTDGVTQ